MELLLHVSTACYSSGKATRAFMQVSIALNEASIGPLHDGTCRSLLNFSERSSVPHLLDSLAQHSKLLLVQCPYGPPKLHGVWNDIEGSRTCQHICQLCEVTWIENTEHLCIVEYPQSHTEMRLLTGRFIVLCFVTAYLSHTIAIPCCTATVMKHTA